MADQKQKYDAALLQRQQEAAAQQQKLLDTTNRLQEVQKHLEEALAAASDARRRHDEAVQLQVAMRDQLNSITTTHKVRLGLEGFLWGGGCCCSAHWRGPKSLFFGSLGDFLGVHIYMPHGHTEG